MFFLGLGGAVSVICDHVLLRTASHGGFMNDTHYFPPRSREGIQSGFVCLDGDTMAVVDVARRLIAKDIRITVTSVL